MIKEKIVDVNEFNYHTPFILVISNLLFKYFFFNVMKSPFYYKEYK